MASPAHTGEPHLAHHFANLDQQYQSAKLGMWVFLATEILFFGGLFCAYVVYRANHPEVFLYAHQFLDKRLGALNTAVLICSSFTIAWAVRAAQLKQVRLLILLLSLTFLLASGFLGVKYIEYRQKWEHGLLWARRYHPEVHLVQESPGHDVEVPGAAPPGPGAQAAQEAPVTPAADGDADRSHIADAATGPVGLAEPMPTSGEHRVVAEPHNAQVFFSIYFLMTGLHGIHVLVGMGLMVWLIALAWRGAFAGGNFTRVDMFGLYWHLVDLIWIYLFLLLYLVH
jgi:cytochrome c oxidase subunit III